VSFAPGALVRARGREWVVLPESEPDLLMLRPLGGTEDEVSGVYLPLEKVEPAVFGLPDASKLGDNASCRLLRDAVRLAFRSSAGPFRSFAQIAVEPRPYQLVPLLLALRQDPVRLLIADDVGIGKTVEAGLIAKELMARGEAKRLAVLCPPHLAEQWQAELRDKFHIDATLVLPGTAGRLDRGLSLGQSLFDVHPNVVVSVDFIKADRRRDDFLRTCPDLVIVDEAHTCAFDRGIGSGHHQRHQLVSGLAKDPKRNLILVTATPHSGKETAFRSLLTFLRTDFANLPDELSGRENEAVRRDLARHVVQRRRADIRHFLGANTIFPERKSTESTWKLTPDYQTLLDRVQRFCRETVQGEEDGSQRQRVRWWAALGLLRALASSPAAAAATLRTRASAADTTTADEADVAGRNAVLDLDAEEGAERLDVSPGADAEDADGDPTRRRLREMAKAAEELKGAKDPKLKRAIAIAKGLLDEGYNPIVFCRFIETADYVAAALRERLGGRETDPQVAAVTGMLPPAEREERVLALGKAAKRVLVATDCLSEGVNLQDHFDAVVHYDLAWNPTRHEQREGRVDRYGQPKPEVRVVTYWGEDNGIDGLVLEVLLRKQRSIRTALGISVPVPVDTNRVVETIFRGMIMRRAEPGQLVMEDVLLPEKEALFNEWEAAAEREKRSRTVFSHEGIKVDEVKQEQDAVRAAIGTGADVATFVRDAVNTHGGQLRPKEVDGLACEIVDLSHVPRALREAVGGGSDPLVRFELPVPDGAVYLHRTHPFVEGLAAHVFTSALDAALADAAAARRAGAIETRDVEKRTTLLLIRHRFHVITSHGEESWPLLAEDVQLLAFRGAPEMAEWLQPADAEALLKAVPVGNVTPDRAREFVEKVLAAAGPVLGPKLLEEGKVRGDALLAAHKRVRDAVRSRGPAIRHRVEPAGTPDLLGVFVLLPAPRD